MKTISFIIVISLIFFSQFLAQIDRYQNSKEIIIDLPLFDFPYQNLAKRTTGNYFKAYANPSISQSLAMSNNFYLLIHNDIKKYVKTESKTLTFLLQNSALILFDFFFVIFPFWKLLASLRIP